MNLNNRKRKADDDYILHEDFRQKLILTNKDIEDDLSSRKRKIYEENIIKKTTIDNTYLIRKRKDNISNETCDFKIRKIYQCSIHEHNKSICEIYNCVGIHNNFVSSNIDMYIN
jgi:hypothetical protein